MNENCSFNVIEISIEEEEDHIVLSTNGNVLGKIPTEIFKDEDDREIGFLNINTEHCKMEIYV